MAEANVVHIRKTQTKLQIEEKLDALVEEAIRVGLSLMDIHHILELKAHTVNDAIAMQETA